MMRLFILLLTVGLSLVSCRGKLPQMEVTVVSYNIRQGVADDGGNSWDLRKGATPAMIDSLKPDLLGLQEAYRFQIDYILENCPEYAFYGVGRNDGGDAGEHTAVLYKKETFKLLEGETFWLSETPDVPSCGWDSKHHRTATMVHLEHLKTGRRLYYVNTHLDHKGTEARKMGLELIVKKIGGMNTSGEPMILTGDFNMTKSDPSILALEGRLLDARESAARTDTLNSFNDWVNAYEAAQPAHLYKRDDNRIDYIYYSPSGMCRKFETDTTTYLETPYISDHYPIFAEIEF